MSVSVTDQLTVYEQSLQMSATIKVEDYAYLVKRIAHHMIARMPSSVQVDDLIQAGMIGLLEAAQKYDGSKGASFETYAGIRIRGAIVDEMRRGDWAPRSVHRNSRRIADAIAKVEAKHGRDARDYEVAKALDVSLDEYYEMVRDSASTRLFSYEENYDEDDHKVLTEDESHIHQSPARTVHQDALQSAVASAIDSLPEREKLVLSLYYDQEMNLKEIGMVLGVSESRVSQIHGQATVRLRARLKDWQQ